MTARRSHASPPRGAAREEAQALAGLVALFVITSAWWALALWPVDGAPAWLERTRYVCFGVAESGLPDTGGWIGLIGGPAGMLTILVVGWRGGMAGLLRRAGRSRMVAATLATLAVGGVVLVTGAATRVQQAKAAAAWAEPTPPVPPPTYPRLDRPAPPLALPSQTGQELDLVSLRGRPVLLTFAYAHCRTVCPVLVTNALRAQAALAADGAANDEAPAVVVVTLDPWRDTPSRLPAIAEGWRLPEGDAWVLSGPVERVEAVLDRWEITRTRDLTTGEVTHPSLTYVIDPAGRIAYASTGGVDALVSLVRRL